MRAGRCGSRGDPGFEGEDVGQAVLGPRDGACARACRAGGVPSVRILTQNRFAVTCAETRGRCAGSSLGGGGRSRGYRGQTQAPLCAVHRARIRRRAEGCPRQTLGARIGHAVRVERAGLPRAGDKPKRGRVGSTGGKLQRCHISDPATRALACTCSDTGKALRYHVVVRLRMGYSAAEKGARAGRRQADHRVCATRGARGGRVPKAAVPRRPLAI